MQDITQDIHQRLELVSVVAENFTRQNVNVYLHQFWLDIKGRLNIMSSVAQTQIAHQVVLALTAHSPSAEDSLIH